jgi:Zyg-11 family protein
MTFIFFQEFPEKHDLLRNMMGLLGNVAEVPELRSQLMTTNFVAEFKMLLESTSDGIEVTEKIYEHLV